MESENGLGNPQDKLILAVDDDDGIRELLEFLIKKEGFRSATAIDGVDGLNKIQELKPDLVILDLMLPRQGGYEVLRQLQAGDTGRIPVLVMTGRYTDHTMSQMIRQESNVVDFFTKPVQPAALSMALHRILKTKPALGARPGGSSV
jgi:CheY-like chemotaxis protein